MYFAVKKYIQATDDGGGVPTPPLHQTCSCRTLATIITIQVQSSDKKQYLQ